jgi:hypothetical protein
LRYCEYCKDYENLTLANESKIGKNLAKKNTLLIIALNGNYRNKQFATKKRKKSDRVA